MNTWYLLTIPAYLILIVTAVARLADLGRADWSFLDHVHRIGHIALAAFFCIRLVSPWIEGGVFYMGRATWMTAWPAWALAAVWVSKRDVVPWWDFILGVHRKTDEWAHLGFRERLQREWRALVASFKPRRYRPPMAGPQGRLP